MTSRSRNRFLAWRNRSSGGWHGGSGGSNQGTGGYQDTTGSSTSSHWNNNNNYDHSGGSSSYPDGGGGASRAMSIFVLIFIAFWFAGFAFMLRTHWRMFSRRGGRDPVSPMEFQQRIQQARKHVLQACKQQQEVKPFFSPASGNYEVRRRHTGTVDRLTISLDFTKTPEGWSVSGRDTGGYFAVIEGNVAHDGTMYWVEEGPALYRFGFIPYNQRTLSKGTFKLGMDVF